MKVVIFSYFDLTKVYGAVWTVARFLQNRGCEVEVVYLGARARCADDSGISVNIIAAGATSGWKRAVAALGAAWRARAARADAILLIGGRSVLFGLPLWKAQRARTAVLAYELEGDSTIERVANWLIRSIDILVDVNRHRARIRRRVARAPDLVVRNVPDSVTQAQITALRATPRTPSANKLMYGGLIATYQGISLLVSAFARSSATELELIGPVVDPKYVDRLRKIALPHDKTLVISPAVPRAELMQRLWSEAAALVCLYPVPAEAGRMGKFNVRYAEPTKFYEFLLLGLPLVSTRHPSLPTDLPGVFVSEEDEASLAEAIDSALAYSSSNLGRAVDRAIELPSYEDQLERLLALL